MIGGWLGWLKGRFAMSGICMCVTGPPPGGVCVACGAVGPPMVYPPPLPYQPLPPAQGGCVPLKQLTEDDVRRIIREELDRAFHKSNEGRA